MGRKKRKILLRTEKTLLAAKRIRDILFDRKNMIYVPDIGELK